MHGGPADPAWSRTVAFALEAFYEQHARDLPWRHRAGDPYAVWVGEVMLQQTRAAVVAGRYERFLERFPDLEHLARAPLSEVLAEWEGLGYYRRAEALSRAAGEAFTRFGALPTDEVALRSLPGFGPYTTAAVLSIAWGEPLAATDGNAVRVFSRMGGFPRDRAYGGNPGGEARGTHGDGESADQGSEAQRRDRAHGLHEGVVRHSRDPGRLNQAVMDVGATLCLPRRAACGRCPVSDLCATCRSFGNPPEIRFARSTKAKTRPEIAVAVARIRGIGGLLLAQKRERGLLRGLWGLPGEEEPVAVPLPRGSRAGTGRTGMRVAGAAPTGAGADAGKDASPRIREAQQTAGRRLRARAAALGVRLECSPVLPFRWQFTHRVWHVTVWDCAEPVDDSQASALADAFHASWLTDEAARSGSAAFGGPFRAALTEDREGRRADGRSQDPDPIGLGGFQAGPSLGDRPDREPVVRSRHASGRAVNRTHRRPS